MDGMAIIDPTIVHAREHAREKTTGRFGEQYHSAPELALDPYPYPRLKGGIRPEDVDVFVRCAPSGLWQVTAQTVRDTDNILAELEVPLSDEHAADFTEDHDWTSLDHAPEWLREAVLPSLVDERLNETTTAEWRRARHQQILADGGFASTYDNSYLITFEDENPNTPQAAADALINLPYPDPGEPDPDREAAAAELSRRAAIGVGGALADARDLRAGDQVSLAHLAIQFGPGDAWVGERYATVTRPDFGGSTGPDDELFLVFDGDFRYVIPAGTRLPAVGFRVNGKDIPARKVIADLTRTEKLPAGATSEMTPAEIIDLYNAENGHEPGDPSYIEPLTPTLTGARL